MLRLSGPKQQNTTRLPGIPSKPIEHRLHRDARGALGREAVDAGRDGGKGDRGEPVLAEKLEAVAVAAREQLVLAALAAAPDRAHGVDHMARRQVESPA